MDWTLVYETLYETTFITTCIRILFQNLAIQNGTFYFKYVYRFFSSLLNCVIAKYEFVVSYLCFYAVYFHNLFCRGKQFISWSMKVTNNL